MTKPKTIRGRLIKEYHIELDVPELSKLGIPEHVGSYRIIHEVELPYTLTKQVVQAGLADSTTLRMLVANVADALVTHGKMADGKEKGPTA